MGMISLISMQLFENAAGSEGVKKSALSGMKKRIEFYTDQELDSESNLYNYDARLYDPVIGRFISADTVVPKWTNPQSLNRYSYCKNNPLIFVDPSGHTDYWANTGGIYDLFPSADFKTGISFLDNTIVSVFNDSINTINKLGNSALNLLGYTSEGINWAEEKVIIDGLGGDKGDVEALNAYLVINGAGISQAITQLKTSSLFSVAPEGGMYRYVGPGEAKVAKQTGLVPNVDLAGKSKNVFYSPERYTSATTAEDALRIGSKNPISPTATPTHRIAVDASKPKWNYGGNIEGGTGTELITREQLQVLSVDPLRK